MEFQDICSCKYNYSCDSFAFMNILFVEVLIQNGQEK